MSLFFITGISGTGKSEVARELKSRGFLAYDTDEDGLARWHNTKSGYIHPKSSVKKERRTVTFLKENSWKVPVSEVEELNKRAKTQDIYLCGVSGDEHEIIDYFKAVFALAVDDETLKHRLQTRTNNDWGKQPHELSLVLEWQRNSIQSYKESGYTIIDATQPVKVVVDEILSF